MSRRQRLTEPVKQKLLKDFYKELYDGRDFHGYDHENLLSESDASDNEDKEIKPMVANGTHFEVDKIDENLDKDLPENERDVVEMAIPRNQ